MATRITLYSDFVCPFCFVTEASSLVRLEREYDVELDWRGFELHPDTPPGGVTLADYFGAARARAMARYIEEFAASFGVFGLAPHERIPNTRKALAVAEWARTKGRLHPLRRAVMNAYWLGGRDIEDDGVLAACASEAGLDPRGAVAAIADPVFRARVDAMGDVAERGEQQHGCLVLRRAQLAQHAESITPG